MLDHPESPWDTLQRIRDRMNDRRHQVYSNEDEMEARHAECERIVDEIELFEKRLADSGATEHMMHSCKMWRAVSEDFLKDAFGAEIERAS